MIFFIDKEGGWKGFGLKKKDHSPLPSSSKMIYLFFHYQKSWPEHYFCLIFRQASYTALKKS
ncbi:hypothetical protein LguiA_030788 [Lonicera macranthoides]